MVSYNVLFTHIHTHINTLMMVVNYTVVTVGQTDRGNALIHQCHRIQ